MLQFAAKLSQDCEYGVTGWGQSNSAPQGTRAEGLAANPQLALKSPGQDITGAVLTGAIAGATETFAVGSTLTASEWVGAEFRAGTTTAPLAGYGTITANTGGAGTSGLTVTWTVAAAAGTVAGYVCFRDDRHKSYANVRMLTPYQPETVGGYPAFAPKVAGYAIPDTVTSYEDLALFLPLTMLEGVASCASAGTGTRGTLTVTCTAGLTGYQGTVANVFAGGYLYVLDPATGNSWRGEVVSSVGHASTPSFTVASFTPSNSAAALPPTGAGAVTFEVHLPHHANNPHHFIPGPGFRYPNHFTVPAGPLLNRATGVLTAAYPDRMGVVLPLAWRLSNQLGKRLNVTWLGVPASSIYRNGTLFGGPSQFGWWKSSVHLDWMPGVVDGCAERMRRLLLMAPNALLAEGNTKPLKNLGLVGFQGESEAGNATGRSLYGQLLPSFYEWLVKSVETAGTSFYATGGKLPLMHALVASYPWEDATLDADGVVNDAIRNLAAKRPFACTIDTNDSARTGEVIHFNGAGEVTNGNLAADALLAEIDDAVSSEDDRNDAEVLAICNMALSHIGETARLTSLDPAVDASVQARLCLQFYRLAREQALQRHTWSFATRRKALEAISGQRTDEWAYAYGMPNNSVKVFGLLPPGAGDDYNENLAPAVLRIDDIGYRQTATGYSPKAFDVEQDSDGYQVIYGKIPDACARFVVQVSDARQYSPTFKAGLSWLLASMLAGPIVKGDNGSAKAAACLQASEVFFTRAASQDASQRRIKIEHVPGSLRARR